MGTIHRNIIQMPKAFVDRHPENYEKYAILSTSSFKELFGDMKGIPDYQLEGLVKITKTKCKPIYRKYVGMSIDGETNYVALGYRSIKYVGEIGDDVKVQKTSWFPYLWHYPDATIRCPFKIAFFAMAITVALGILQLFI